jgi:hypothetical protein
MGNSRIELRLESRLKEDFEKCVPNTSAFLRRCIIEMTYGADPARWPTYIHTSGRGRPNPLVMDTPSLVQEIVPVKVSEIPKNIVDMVFGRHLSPSAGSMLDNPPEGIIGEGANEGYGVGEDAQKLTLDEMIEAIKNETRKEIDNDTART